MKKLKCIIVDDELGAIESLMVLIKNIPELQLVGTFTNPLNALSFLRKNDVYLVFLDINMESLSGLDLARLIENKIIFTTGFAEFAFKSYELTNVVDYLAKPIYLDRLAKAIMKVSQRFVADNIAPQAYVEGYLTFEHQGATTKIDHGSISFIQASTNYSIVHYEGKKIMAPIPIWDLEHLLPVSRFQRVSKSSIVNRDKIVSEDAKEIILLGGRKLKIGKAFRQNSNANKD